MRIGVLTVGYVGSVPAACLAPEGPSVIGVDVKPHKGEVARSARSLLIEPGPGQLVASAAANSKSVLTTPHADILKEVRAILPEEYAVENIGLVGGIL